MNYILVKFQKEGVHRWKDCPYDDVSFLKDYHRHIFFFEVKMEVFQDDREVEFIRLKRYLEYFIENLFLKGLDLSCEAIANLVLSELKGQYGDRYYDILVLEDNENGGGVIQQRLV